LDEEENQLKKIISILLSVLIISSSLSSIEVTLINGKIITGSFIKHEYEEIYLSKDKELYIIGDDAISNLNYAPNEENQPIKRINYNSFKKIRRIYKKDVLTHNPEANLTIKSFSMNDEIILFEYYKMMKIQLLNGDVFVGRFLGETNTEIKLLTLNEKSFIKQNIQHIWQLTESEKTGRKAGGIVGGLIGIIMGLATAAFISLDDDGSHSTEATLVIPIFTVIGIGSGCLVGSLAGSLLANKKLVWSRN